MIEIVAIGWMLGLGLAGLTLWAFGKAQPQRERLLNVVALMWWVLACIAIGLLLAAWWMPSA